MLGGIFVSSHDEPDNTRELKDTVHDGVARVRFRVVSKAWFMPNFGSYTAATCNCCQIRVAGPADPKYTNTFYGSNNSGGFRRQNLYLPPEKIDTDNEVCVCVYVCIFIELHITAQSGPVTVVILCHLH